MCHLSRGIIAQSLSLKANTGRKNILKQIMNSFTPDLTCVTSPLLPETVHLLQVQSGRGGRHEAIEIIYCMFYGVYYTLYVIPYTI